MRTEREQGVKARVRVSCRRPSVGTMLAGIVLNPSPAKLGVLRKWPRAPIGKASCVYRSSPVRSRSIQPPPRARRFRSTSSTGRHRIRYFKVDADTGAEVANEDIVKGYALDKDTFIEVTKEVLENVALESTRTIEIDEFVDRSEIDPRYLIRPFICGPTASSAMKPLP